MVVLRAVTPTPSEPSSVDAAPVEVAERAQPEAAPAPPPSWWGWVARRGPLLVVLATVVFNLWALHSETLTTAYANDSSVHVAMAKWAELRVREGHLPFDGWFPYLDLGASRFHHYQSLPAIVTGSLGALVGTDGVFHWLTYLLIALWPICVYVSARLLEWEPWPAALSAAVSPLLVSRPALGYEWGSYAWGGFGVYTQLWGMWFLPLSWALTWRAVSGRGRAWPAVLVASLAIASHFLTGYLALLVIGVWVLIKPSELLRRAGRALLVGAGTLVAASWVLVPLLTDAKWTTQLAGLTPTTNSFGALKVLRWLFTGAIFDHRRFPVLSLLAGVGFVVCLIRFRRDERARALLGAGTLSMLLFFGRPTLGPVVDLLPGSHDLFLRRYIMGVHLAGIFLAGIGAVTVCRLLVRLGRRLWPSRRPAWRPALVWGLAGAAVAGILAPGFVDRGWFGLRENRFMAVQRHAEDTAGADFRALMAKARALGPGRVFAGTGSSWGKDYQVGYVPLDIEVLNSTMDGVGFVRPTWSLSSRVTGKFDFTDPDHYDLFDVRYLVEPAGKDPFVTATKVATRGPFELFRVPTSGYFELVDTLSPIKADRTNLGDQVAQFLDSDLVRRHLFPTIAFAGAPAAPPTIGPGQPGETPLGTVLRQSADPANGRFTATVRIDRRAMLVLKSSFDPRWRVTVDGRPLAPQMVAPSFVGRELWPGKHTVVFQYVAYPHYAVLLLVSTLSVAGIALVGRLGRRRRRTVEADAPAA